MRQRFKIFLILFLTLIVNSSGFSRTKSAVDWFEEGQRALMSRNYYLAIDSFIESLEKNPNYIESYKGLMSSYIALSQYDKAFSYSQKALPFAEGDLDFYAMYGNLLRERGDYKGSISFFQKVLDKEQNNLSAILGMARVYRDQNNFILSLQYYNHIFVLHPENSSVPAGEVVQIYLKEGKLKEAEEFIHKIENYYQNSPEFSEISAQFFLEKGDFEQAYKFSQHFLSLSQKLGFQDLVIRAYALTGRIIFLRGENKKAIEVFKQALNWQRESTLLNYLLGVAYLREQDILQAQNFFYRAFEESKGGEIYKEALEASFFIFPSFESPYRSRIASFYDKKSRELSKMYLYERSLSQAKQAIEIDPYRDSLRLLLAKLYRSLGLSTMSFRELSFLVNERNYHNDESESLWEFQQLVFLRSPFYFWGFKEVSDLNHLFEERNRLKVAIFYTQREKNEQSSTEFFLRALKRALERTSRIQVENSSILDDKQIPYFIPRISEGFRYARTHGLDYYIVINPQNELKGGFSVEADIFLANSATKVKSIRISRLNEKSRSSALEQLSRNLEEYFPVKGSFIRRDENRALINLGKLDKLELGSELAIVNESDVSFSLETGLYLWDPQKEVGRAKITKLDDFASEVSLEKKGMLDEIESSQYLLPLN